MWDWASLTFMPGIFLLAGMGSQIPAGDLVVSIGGDGTPKMQTQDVRLKMDLWSTWLEIGCVHTDKARVAGQQLNSELSDSEKAALLSDELQAGLVAITAFAFSLDGFYDTVRNELGAHPNQVVWKKREKNSTSRAAQISETLRYRLKLNHTFSAQLRQYIEELFKFRARAVHPDGKWVKPNYRPEIDNDVHPHLITFSGPHAVLCRALTLNLLDRLVERATYLSKSDADKGWLERGREELDRLMPLYRIPGDDQLAFPTVC